VAVPEPTRTNMSDPITTFQDNACSFMSDNTITLEYKFSDPTGFPEMEIRTFVHTLVKLAY
jgi:hypothetical protein